MSNEIRVFENQQFGEIRVVERDGEPWFVAADVCKALDLEDVNKAMSRIDTDEGTRIEIPHPQSAEKTMEVNAVNEPGLYSLVLGSRKPEAKEFKRWVTHEVLPSIRKHGAYMTPPTIETLLENPDMIIEMATILKEERAKRKELEKQQEIDRPKVEYFNGLVDRNLLTNFRDTAKEFHMKQSELINALLEHGYIYRSASGYKKGKLLPHQKYMDDGLFELKEFTAHGSKYADNQTLITPKGRETFRILLKQ